MTKHIVDDVSSGEQYPIRPEHINANERLWNSFGNMETEILALRIVRLCQRRGAWMAFTKRQISRGWLQFYGLRVSEKDESLNFIQCVGNKYYVTHEFIAECFRSSPAVSLIRMPEIMAEEEVTAEEEIAHVTCIK